MALTFFSDDTGTGISSGLGRGLVASKKGINITGEGMGVGAVAVRTGGYTYFAETKGVSKVKGKTVKTFLINKRMVWTFLGRPLLFLTRLAERSTLLYMSGGIIQKTLMSAGFLAFIKKILGLKAEFVTVSPVASAKCEFTAAAGGIKVRCGVKMTSDAKAAVYLMNEFSADYFDEASLNNEKTGLPSGWEKLAEHDVMPCLSWKNGGVDFSVTKPTAKPRIPVGIFWGREKAEGISWAGFEFEAMFKGRKSATISYNLVLSGKGAAL